MEDRIGDILQLCLDRMDEGESIEDCLAQYPGEAGGLEPLVRTALSAQGRFTPGIPMGTRARVRNRVTGAAGVNARVPGYASLSCFPGGPWWPR